MKHWIALLFIVLATRSAAVEYSTALASGKKVIVCRIDLKKEQLRLFLRDDDNKPLKSFLGIRLWLQKKNEKLVFAMNAGMYHSNLSPVGLFVENGRQIAPLNLAEGEGNFFLKPNGVFLLSASGAHVVESAEMLTFHDKISLASQSGPLLVCAGKIHPRFKPDSEFRLVRNGVGVPSSDVVLFAISEEPVNLYEFAAFFKDTLHCPDALYFDGTVSSLHAPELHRSDMLIDLGPVIGITELK